MLTASKDGIICDCCKSQHKDRFTYYSADFKRMDVINNTLPPFDYSPSSALSIDICEACMEVIKELVKKNYKAKRMLTGRVCPDGIVCDLTGELLKNQYTFYHCIIAKAAVSITKSGATTDVDQRYLELWISEKAYKEYEKKAQALRNNKEIAQWSASSE